MSKTTDHMDFWEKLARAQLHGTALRILEIAKRGEPFSPNGAATELREPIGNISYHVKALKDRGMLELVRTEPRRGAVEHFYRLTVRAPKKTKVGPSEEVALKALDDAFFEALAAGVNSAQVEARFAELEAREAPEAVAA